MTKFFPDKNNNSELNSFFKKKNQQKITYTKTKTSLKNIQENENIIIKEPDKGSAVVSIKRTTKLKSNKYWKMKPTTN